MSRIVVVGAHGRTGLLIVELLVKAGDTVLATDPQTGVTAPEKSRP